MSLRATGHLIVVNESALVRELGGRTAGSRMSPGVQITCPVCGERAGLPIVWGLVPQDEAERTDVALGGCVVPAVPPTHRCGACGHEWRHEPVGLAWPDPSEHDDGDLVSVRGTIGRVVLDSSGRGGVWAEFVLVVGEDLPRLRCLAFPTAFAALEVALEPGLEVRLHGRLSKAQGPELHVTGWTDLDTRVGHTDASPSHTQEA